MAKKLTGAYPKLTLYTKQKNPKSSMTNLAQENCEPCKGGTTPLTPQEYSPFIHELSSQWSVQDETKLTRSFRFSDFKSALAFTNKLGQLAEEQGHHPDIYLSWGKVIVTLWTHKIHGLSKSDFVMAAKIDSITTLSKPDL